MGNRFIYFGVLVLGVCIGFSLFGQVNVQQMGINIGADLVAPGASASPDIMLARSSADYRVTQGDVYTLSYIVGSNPVSYVAVVDSSYRIRVSNLGVINGAGKTFMQIKSEAETIVTNNYPLSGVQFVLTQPAVFSVQVNGEVNVAGDVSVWALRRLSSLAGDNLTGYASVRDVSVRSSNGQTRAYDLFKAWRLGDLSQDPYLRPGDIVTFNRIDRVVTVDGAVERPGTYQILKGENLKELVEFYANGFTHQADISRIELIRMVNSGVATGDKIFLTGNDLANNFALEGFDEIFVPSIVQLRPVMFVEGAVISTAQAAAQAASQAQTLTSSNRLLVQFTQGETYASLVRRNIGWFTMVSDTENAYILRNSGHIPINLNPILYDTFYHDNVPVEENDVLVIPFRQYFVTVAGAVLLPGRYPYIPDRDWEYYIGLAGGFIPERNTVKSVTITDMNGKQMNKTDAISPETAITAVTNHPLYYFNMYAPVISTVLGLISSSLALWAILR